MTTPAELLRKHIPNIESVSAAPKQYPKLLGLVTDEYLKQEFFREAAKAGLTLTEQQKQAVTVTNGIISSPDFIAIKAVLGLDSTHNQMSEQLERALKHRAVIDALKEHFKIEKSSALEAAAILVAQGVDTTSPAITPAKPQGRGGRSLD